MSFIALEKGSKEIGKSPQNRFQSELIRTSPGVKRSHSNLAGIVYLSMKDYEKIKKNSGMLGKNCESPKKEETFDFHKKKLLELDSLKRQMGVHERTSETELENINKKNNLLRMSRAKQEEQSEIVREMNKIMLYSQVQTIRDRQLEEKKKIRESSREEDVKLDTLMELERLKDLQHFEEMETQKKISQIKGAMVIQDQIKEREILRTKIKEQIAKEKEELLQNVKNSEENAKVQMEEERIRKEKAIKENTEANRQSIEFKKKKINDERESELKVLQYLHEKNLKEENEAREHRRLKEEKEKEVQRLRERQEKAHDKVSDLQALRAKRSIEEAERQMRNKEIKELEAKKKQIDEFISINKKQKLDKEILMVEQASLNELEFKKIIEKQVQDKENEERKIIDRKKLLENHNFELRRQIKEKEEDEKMKAREHIEEGRKIKQGNIEEIKRYEEIKKEKLQQLKEMGIDEKYVVDLEKLSVIPTGKLQSLYLKSKDNKKK